MRNPIWIQGHHRWRNDDGTITTATWAGNEDAAITWDDGTVKRLRWNWGDSNNQSEGIQCDPYIAYSVNGGTWTTVGSGTTVQYSESSQGVFELSGAVQSSSASLHESSQSSPVLWPGQGGLLLTQLPVPLHVSTPLQ